MDMQSFEHKIYARIPEISDAHYCRESERQAARIQSELDYREAQERLARAANFSRKMGRAAVDILVREGVPDMPIIVTRYSGYTHEVARGWHISKTYIHHDGFSSSSRLIGLNHRADMLLFTTTSIEKKGTAWSGIIAPTEVRDGPEKLKILEDEMFRDGMASLIAGFGPNM